MRDRQKPESGLMTVRAGRTYAGEGERGSCGHTDGDGYVQPSTWKGDIPMRTKGKDYKA